MLVTIGQVSDQSFDYIIAGELYPWSSSPISHELPLCMQVEEYGHRKTRPSSLAHV